MVGEIAEPVPGVEESKPLEAAPAVCRICGRPGGGNEGPLVVPCCCIGSSRFVHSKCLNLQRTREGLLSDSFWECSVCGGEYNLKASGRLLKTLRLPMIIVLSCLCCLCVIVLAAEIFKHLIIYIGPYVVDKRVNKDGNQTQAADVSVQNETQTWDPAESIGFIWNGVDVSYWVGGLLMITLLRKVYDAKVQNSYSGLLQYVFFIPSLLSMTQYPEMGNHVWVMLPIYALHNTSFMILTVCSLMRAMLSLFTGEEAVDFLGVTAETQQGSEDELAEVCDNDSELCLCCWDSRAQFKMKACNHLVACAVCRRRLIYRELKLQSTRGVPRMRDMTQKHLQETRVKCPLCRKLDVMVTS